MTRAVTFIDTSVLCNILPVPGRAQQHDEVVSDLARRMAAREEFILPITAVIETGNFIAQLADGGERRATARKFHDLLELVRESKTPWILHDVPWDREFLGQFLEGADTGSPYVDHATARVGAGDLCILTERASYQRRTGLRAAVWSLVRQLAAYS